MSGFEDIIKELIVLSDLIRKQDFRACFITHFIEKCKEFESASSKVDVKIVQRLQSKLLDPLTYHLKYTNNSNDKCTVILCIVQVLKVTQIDYVNDFFEVYTTVFFQIYKEGNLTYQPSEELKECVLQCCSSLLNNSTQRLLEKIYSEEFMAKFGFGISLSINIVKEERSIKLRLAALNFLLTATRFKNQLNYAEKIYIKIGDLFMFYLPGILGPLLEVVSRDETQHHLITTKALTCWGHVLCLVMKDSTQTEGLSDNEIIQQWLQSKINTKDTVIDVKKGLQEKKRTKLWLESAAVTMQPLIVKLSNLQKHSHPKCRLALTLVMVKLLGNCIRNLKNCLPVIVEVLVSSSSDEDPEVCQVAKEALSELETECDTKNIFVPVIEENLFSVINKLPRIAQSGNEQLLLVSLKSLSGYLRILGRQNRLQHLFSLSSTLKKLISVIKISFELELYPEISNQDFSAWANESDSLLWYKPWKRFRHFADESVKNQLEQICRNLGNFSRFETIFDFLLDTYNDYYSFRNEILLILNEVILGSEEVKDHTANHLLDFYLEPQNLRPPLQVNDDDCSNLREAQTNIIKVALIMEGIGKLAKRLGIRFQEYLLKSLYYVLERMGSSFSIIREAATKSAIEIANACDLDGNVKYLIQNNVDYLSYHLTVKLKRNDDSVFDVITVLMKNSPFEAMSNLEEIINSALKSSSQSFDSPHTLAYLRLFHTFVFCVKKWIKTDEKPVLSARPEISDLDRLMKYLESVTKRETTSDEEESEVTSAEEEQEIPEEPKKPELPKHLKLTLAVANHCLHYLASKDKHRKIIVLEILNECVWALANREDDLLPLVHNIWSPLVTRFDATTDPLIINRSFTLLCSLAFTSKDFIRARTLKNVLPALESFLTKQAARSKLKDSASGYFFTQNFKLQRELLAQLGKVTSSLRLHEKLTDAVIESALPYLSALQPRELQEKCKILFDDLIAYDKYLVWHKVHNLVKNPEFSKNVETILNSIK